MRIRNRFHQLKIMFTSRVVFLTLSTTLISSCGNFLHTTSYSPDLAITSPFGIEIERLHPDSSGEELKTAFWEEGFTIHDMETGSRPIIKFKDAQLSIAIAPDQESGNLVAYAQFRGSISTPNPAWSTSAEFNDMRGQWITVELLGEDEGLIGVLISDEFVIRCNQSNQLVLHGERKFRIENDTVNLFTLAKKARLTPKPYEWRSCPKQN